MPAEKRPQVLQDRFEQAAEDCMISDSALLPLSQKKAIYDPWAI